jgi:hypothetical protein
MSTLDNGHVAIAALFEHARLKAQLDSTALDHLAACESCRQRLAWMQNAADLGSREATYEPPVAVMEKVLGLGRSTSRLAQFRNAIVALLTFDSLGEAAPAGIRRSEAVSRQLTFQAEELEIGLWLRRSEDGTMTISGQVLGKAGTPIEDKSAHADLVASGEHIDTAPLTAWGEFVFADLLPTEYSLQISILDRVVRIPGINGRGGTGQQ